MPKKTFVIEWDWPVEEFWLPADSVALALHAYCKNTKFTVMEATQQSVQRTAGRLCTDTVHVGPFKITPEGNTKCDACGAEWYNPNR